MQRAADVVRQLRALIRLDQSGRAPIRVERIIRETLDLCRPELERHGALARVSVAPDLPPVMADLLQVEQVLLNLLRNSAEAMQATHGGVVTVTAAAKDADQVEFEVRDTGPGFPPDFVEGDFPLLSSSKTDGLGMGLSLCRSIIEAHGGRLSVGGGGRGGAVVRFTLPVARAMAGHADG